MTYKPVFPYVVILLFSLMFSLQLLFLSRYRFVSERCSNPHVGEKYCYSDPLCDTSSISSKIILEDVLSLNNNITPSDIKTYQEMNIDYYDKGLSVIKTFKICSILNKNVPTGGKNFPENYGSSSGYFNIENGVCVYLAGLSSDWNNNSNQILSLYTEAIGSCITGPGASPGTSNILNTTNKGFLVTPNKNDKTLNIDLITSITYSGLNREPNIGISSDTFGSGDNIFTNFNDKKQLTYVQRIIESKEMTNVLENLRISRNNQRRARDTNPANLNKCLDPSGAPPECDLDDNGLPKFIKETNTYLSNNNPVNYCVTSSNQSQEANSFQTNFYNVKAEVGNNGKIGNLAGGGNAFEKGLEKNYKFEKGLKTVPNGFNLNTQYDSELDFCAAGRKGNSPERFNFTNNDLGQVWGSSQSNFTEKEGVFILGFE